MLEDEDMVAAAAWAGDGDEAGIVMSRPRRCRRRWQSPLGHLLITRQAVLMLRGRRTDDLLAEVAVATAVLVIQRQ